MTRLGINIPKELMDRLAPLKGAINISKVCRDALEAKAAAYERASQRVSDDGLADLIQRLKEEYLALDIDWEALGHEDAKVWVESVSYSELQKHMSFWKKRGEPVMVMAITPFAQRQDSFRKEILELYDLDLNVNWYQTAQDAYYQGWYLYLTRVWELLQAEIARHIQSKQYRRAEALADVNPPEHLAAPLPKAKP